MSTEQTLWHIHGESVDAMAGDVTQLLLEYAEGNGENLPGEAVKDPSDEESIGRQAQPRDLLAHRPPLLNETKSSRCQ